MGQREEERIKRRKQQDRVLEGVGEGESEWSEGWPLAGLTGSCGTGVHQVDGCAGPPPGAPHLANMLWSRGS